MGQHGRDAARARLEAFEAQQRIEPDQPAAGAVQPVHLEGERVVGVALEPVGDEKDDRALAEHAPRPQLVEGMCSDDAIRVPPDQSCTLAEQAAKRVVGIARRAARG